MTLKRKKTADENDSINVKRVRNCSKSYEEGAKKMIKILKTLRKFKKLNFVLNK